MPMVKYRVRTLVANMLKMRHIVARTAPPIVTARQPYLFTKILERGPETKMLIKDQN